MSLLHVNSFKYATVLKSMSDRADTGQVMAWPPLVRRSSALIRAETEPCSAAGHNERLDGPLLLGRIFPERLGEPGVIRQANAQWST